MTAHTGTPTLALRGLLGGGGDGLAIDLGTTTTRIYARDGGIVVAEPSVVALDIHTQDVLAIGHAARVVARKAPFDIILVRPMRRSVVADGHALTALLAGCLDRMASIRPRASVDRPTDTPVLEHLPVVCHAQDGLVSPHVVIGVPADATASETRAATEAVCNAGARSVYPIGAPLAAAIGGGLPIAAAAGSMVVDIGGGRTEIAVIALGGSVVARALPIAGDELDAAIQQFVRDRYALLIGEQTAEDAKLIAGSAAPLDQERTVVLRGRDAQTGALRAIRVSSVELRTATDRPVRAIAAAVREVLDETPPELLTDIQERGMVLTGGSALLRGLPQRLSAETGIPVHVAHTPTSAVLRGLGQLVDLPDDPVYRRVLEFNRAMGPVLQATA